MAKRSIKGLDKDKPPIKPRKGAAKRKKGAKKKAAKKKAAPKKKSAKR